MKGGHYRALTFCLRGSQGNLVTYASLDRGEKGKTMSKAAWFLLFALTLGGYGFYPTTVLAQPPDQPDQQQVEGALDVAPALPAGHVARYRLTYMTSQTTAANRTSTVVSITNQRSSGNCTTSVDWRVGFGGVSCTTTLTLGPGQTGEHCSRPLPNQVAVCNATCSPALTNIEGNAVIGSQNVTGCNLIAVDGRIYHTTGSTDSAVAAVTNPHVVRIGAGNAGD
jgi:hypothetical protein